MLQKLSVLNWMCILLISLLHLGRTVSGRFDNEGFETLRELKLHMSYAVGFSLDEVEFLPRGIITIRNLKGPKYSIQQNKLNAQDLKKFEMIAEKDGFYFLQLAIKHPSGDKLYHTFSPLKLLLDSELSDMISIHVTPFEDIFSVSYSMTQQKKSISHVPSQFNTTVIVHHGEIGPIPETGPYLEKLEAEKRARERGEDGKDNRSFLGRYWMYIVPVAVLILLSGASNPEGGS